MRYFSRHYQVAVDLFLKMEAFNPSFYLMREMLAECHARLGSKSTAVSYAEAALKDSRHRPQTLTFAAVTFALTGERPRARALAGEAEARFREAKYFQPVHPARAFAELGELNHAFQLLEGAVEVRDTGLAMVPVHHSFEPLRRDARYKPFMARTGIVYPGKLPR
jgi:tetratricopeptide (TPR) repeat protein